MAIGVSGGKSKNTTQQRQAFNQTSTFTPTAGFQTGVDRGVGRVNALMDRGYQGVTDADIDRFQNPYTDDVVNAAMGDIDRSRQMVQQDNDAGAARAGAFGGSRHGILGAETNSEFDRNGAGILAGLRSQGFDRALTAAQGEATNRNAFDLAGVSSLQQLLSLLSSAGTTTTSGTSTGNGTSSGTNFGFTGSYGR